MPWCNNAMTELEFWELIDLARSSVATPAEMPKWIINYLLSLSESDIADYGRIFRQASRRAYDERLWAAAYAISHHFASDDLFSDFRGWLIAQGEKVYQTALSDPDSLEQLERLEVGTGRIARMEKMLYVADKAYESKTGGKDLADFIGLLPPPMLQNEGIWDGTPESVSRIV